MKLHLCSIVLNESEWLWYNYLQHKDWPNLCRWTIVHGADVNYGQRNPELVTPDGMSVDDTEDTLSRISKIDDRVDVIHHGWMKHDVKDQCKCEGRNRYMEISNKIKPDFVFIVDIDEFYTKKDQLRITQTLHASQPNEFAFVFKQRHLFKPPQSTWQDPFKYEVTGGYWSVPHVRGWRWEPGVRYANNHNWLQDRWGTYLTHKGKQYRGDKQLGTPECVHLGYASCGKKRAAKHAYYVARGEGSEGGRIGKNRSMYVECREWWFSWTENSKSVHNSRVIPYTGSIPEVFNEKARRPD